MVKEEVLLAVVFAAAAVLHGISGTGYPLITVAALSAYYPLADSVVFVLIPTALLNLCAWLIGGGSIRYNFSHYLRKYWLLVVLSFAASILGAYLLLWVNQNYLLLLLAAILAWYTGSAWSGRQIRLPDTGTSLAAAGILGGIAGGATSAMSPVLMMYLLSVSDDKDTVIKVGNVCFFVSKLAQACVLYPAFLAMPAAKWGQIGTAALLSLACVFAGMWLGRYLPKRHFRTLILCILAVLAVKLGYSGISGLLGG